MFVFLSISPISMSWFLCSSICLYLFTDLFTYLSAYLFLSTYLSNLFTDLFTYLSTYLFLSTYLSISLIFFHALSISISNSITVSISFSIPVHPLTHPSIYLKGKDRAMFPMFPSTSFKKVEVDRSKARQLHETSSKSVMLTAPKRSNSARLLQCLYLTTPNTQSSSDSPVPMCFPIIPFHLFEELGLPRTSEARS